jgi:tetratricopeptide (TPR) repeat protein
MIVIICFKSFGDIEKIEKTDINNGTNITREKPIKEEVLLEKKIVNNYNYNEEIYIKALEINEQSINNVERIINIFIGFCSLIGIGFTIKWFVDFKKIDKISERMNEELKKIKEKTDEELRILKEKIKKDREELEKLIEIEKYNKELQRLKQETEVDGQLIMALEEREKKIDIEIEKEIEKEIEGKNINSTNKAKKKDLLYLKIDTLKKEGKTGHKKIIEEYEKILEVCISQQDKSEIYMKIGNQCCYKKKYVEAISKYEIARELNPENKTAVYNIGLCYLKKGQIEKNIEYLDVAIEKLEESIKKGFENANVYKLKTLITKYEITKNSELLLEIRRLSDYNKMENIRIKMEYKKRLEDFNKKCEIRKRDSK